MIENVKKFCAELQIVSLRHWEFLGQEEVPVLLEGSTRLGDVAPQISEQRPSARSDRE